MKVTLTNAPKKDITGKSEFEFKIEDVSLACLIKYANFNNVEIQTISKYSVPNGLDNDSEEMFKSFIETSLAMYDKFRNKYNIEVAEYLLPLATCVDVFSKLTVRELLYFLSVSCMWNTHKELKDLADEMLRQVRGLYPSVFKYI